MTDIEHWLEATSVVDVFQPEDLKGIPHDLLQELLEDYCTKVRDEGYRLDRGYREEVLKRLVDKGRYKATRAANPPSKVTFRQQLLDRWLQGREVHPSFFWETHHQKMAFQVARWLEPVLGEDFRVSLRPLLLAIIEDAMKTMTLGEFARAINPKEHHDPA